MLPQLLINISLLLLFKLYFIAFKPLLLSYSLTLISNLLILLTNSSILYIPINTIIIIIFIYIF